MRHLNLINNRYNISFQCWNCFGSFTNWTDLTSLTNFDVGCQNSIDNKLIARRCLLCNQENETLEKLNGSFQKLTPFLILETGHLENSSTLESMIETILSIAHMDQIITYRLLGYTLLSGGHFSLKTYIEGKLYCYDGMEDLHITGSVQQKIARATRYNSPIAANVNFIIYILDRNAKL